MELYNELNGSEDNTSAYEFSENNCTTSSRSNNLFKNILNVLNFKPENNRLDIGGLSFDIDTIIILGIAFFLLTDNSCDILLIICLGLALFNVNLNPFR